MLKIHSKEEVKQAVDKNLNRFLDAADSIVKANLKRDEKFIVEEVLPKLKHALALEHFFEKLEWFDFALPYMDFGNYELTEEEKCKIEHRYYHQEGTLWKWDNTRGEVSKASLVGKIFSKHLNLKLSLVFKECEVNKDTNQVHFKLHLIEEIIKSNVDEEEAGIMKIMDGYVKKHFTFKKVAKSINDFYQLLTGEHPLAIYRRDLEIYPILEMNVEKILQKTNFYQDIELPDKTLKIDIRNYPKKSKLIQSIKNKVRKYGYVLRIESKRFDENDTFRHNGFEVEMDSVRPSQQVKDESLVKSEEFLETFAKKESEYSEILDKMMKKENSKLIQMVKNGHFDEIIARQWMKATVMGTEWVTGRHFYTERGCEGVYFNFIFPFDREIANLITFKRKYHISDGLGIRYMNMDNNVLNAMKERYPFFKACRLTGDDFYDFKVQRGMWNTDEFHIEPNTLEFGFKADREMYVSHKQEIFDWLSSYYGSLDLTSIFEEIEFNEEGVSQKINDFAKGQCKGEKTARRNVEILLGSISQETILSLYQTNPLYSKTKGMFEDNHEDDFHEYWRLKQEYKDGLYKQYQSVKLANLFTYSIMVNPLFKEMAEELEQFRYKMKIEYVSKNERDVETGDTSGYGNKITNRVEEYDVRLVVE